jgi:hypothetical protein
MLFAVSRAGLSPAGEPQSSEGDTMTRRLFFLGLVLIYCGTSAQALAADVPLVVHEWGTFTSLQDESGRELSGINTDDEPVPHFVHNLNRFLLSRPVLSSLHWQYRQKGAPRVHPFVTMRLETPVIYFYPQQPLHEPLDIDVSVRFRGGWLTEFFPLAQAETPRLKDNSFDFGELTPQTVSSLHWKRLQIGGEGAGPETTEHVWLAPRQVKAANLTTAEGESERYLFYRGVGRIRAPLKATLARKAGEVSLSANFDEVLSSRQSAHIGALWLVQVREDGQCAFRTLDGFDVSGDSGAKLASANYRFAPAEFAAENRARLESAMHAALIADGLYADEATALLTTWQRSYFASPGLRLFYLVPRVWTDHYLPLSLSRPAAVNRVMIGRLELISDEQRALLDRLAKVAPSDGRWIEEIPESAARERFLAGRTDFGDLGVAIPPDYQMYLALGRFRNALVAHEEHVRPSETLTRFVDTYELHPFRLSK